MSIGRALAWPFRRLLDPRFGGLAKQADVQHLDLAERLDSLNRRIAHQETIAAEAFEAVRHELASMREQLVAMPAQELAAIRRELASAARADMEATRETNELLARTLGDLLAEATATTLALEEHLGRDLRVDPAQRGLWFNPPISVAYEEGDVRATAASERIVELPYVHRALAAVETGARVLDIGGAESTLAFSLASLGFQVTVVDLRPYPLSHPALEFVEADFVDWDADRSFDVVLCVSSLAQIGLGSDGETEREAGSSTDTQALKRIRALTRPAGLLVLTVPFDASADLTQRGYDRAALERLLTEWDVEDLTIVRRDDPLTWVPDHNGDPPEDARRVALVTARRADD